MLKKLATLNSKHIVGHSKRLFSLKSSSDWLSSEESMNKHLNVLDHAFLTLDQKSTEALNSMKTHSSPLARKSNKDEVEKYKQILLEKHSESLLEQSKEKLRAAQNPYNNPERAVSP